MRPRTLFVVLVALGCTLPTAPAGAQVLTGNIIGVVRDESRAVLPGVAVSAESPARPGGPATAVTNAQGEYRLTRLDPGVYTLTIQLQGFRGYQEQELRVTVGGTIERNVTLAIAAVAETITVSGQAPVVDSRQTGLSATLTGETVQNVPHSRIHISGLMATLPGVSVGNYNRIGAVSVMGSAGNEVS